MKCLCGKEFEAKKQCDGHKSYCKEYKQYIDTTLPYDFLYGLIVVDGRTSNDVVNSFFIENPYINNASIIIKQCKKYGIRTPTVKESCNNENTLEKRTKTCLSIYGTPNVLSKGSPIYHKRNQIVRSRYGVDNVFQLDVVKDLMELTYQQKYNMSRTEHKRTTTTEAWHRLTDDQKNIWLDKSIHSDVARSNWITTGCRVSTIEQRVKNILDSNLISYQHNFCIKISNKSRRYYDFWLLDSNILIEVNGDYWHANPSFYKENDLIHYMYESKTAGYIWEKDRFKRNTAEQKGFTVIYIWESEMKRQTDDVVLQIIKDRIYENQINKEDNVKI